MTDPYDDKAKQTIDDAETIVKHHLGKLLTHPRAQAAKARLRIGLGRFLREVDRWIGPAPKDDEE